MSALPAPSLFPAAPFSPLELGEAALTGFFHITGRWQLTNAEQMVLLGQPARSTFFAWKKDPATALSRDTLERISYVLGIWKALRILIPDEPQALAWVRNPNDHPLFAGRPPLAVLLQGRILDLADVRRLLDARRGVW
jgi:hypothetical protein